MARTVIDTLTYERCGEILGAKMMKKLADNTHLSRVFGSAHGTSYQVVLHGTPILIFREDGAVEYRTNGYRTATTKERMNRYGPAKVYQHRNMWHVDSWCGAQIFEEGYTWYPHAANILGNHYDAFRKDEIGRGIVERIQQDPNDPAPRMAMRDRMIELGLTN
jgi:hypothetical protein